MHKISHIKCKKFYSCLQLIASMHPEGFWYEPERLRSRSAHISLEILKS